jgi:alpha-mannosidase
MRAGTRIEVSLNGRIVLLETEVHMAIQGMKNLNTLYLRKIKSRVAEIRARFLYSDRTPIDELSMAETSKHLTIAEARRLPYKPVAEGQRWGHNWGTAWFRLRITVPRSMRGDTVMLLFDLENGEGLIFRDGEPVQGLCWSRKEYVLLDKARGGEQIELFVEAGANARLGAFVERAVHRPEIAVLNPEVWDAFWDISALADIVDPELHKDWTGKPYHLPFDGDTLLARIVFALNEAVDLFDYREPSREELRAQAGRVRRRLKPIYACKATDAAQTFAAMGHAHIDVAWKWPLSETVRKCGRTFANVLDLMERYDDFVFAQSQPQLYAYAADRYPSLYKRVREMVKQKRWIPTGCMWVEADCNITGGESLVRQILFGTRFFQQEFQYRAETLWLPDVFGFSAALPQIMKRSGINYFFTTKLALNQFMKFPYHTFHWEGLDGSQVLSHFMPGEEYSAELEPWLIRTAVHDYAEKDRCSLQVMPFGHGDGGGGPARAHLERLRRFADFEAMPRLVSMAPDAFFAELERESRKLPLWRGELYLQNHRGTYTSEAQVKKNNRQAELLLRETEMLAALAMAQGAGYDQNGLADAWKLVLLNQFHDILPGSSIDEVYEESERQFDTVFSQVGAIRDAAFQRLARHVDTRGAGEPVLAFNALSWTRRDLIEVEAQTLGKGKTWEAAGSDGEISPVQVGWDGKARFAGKAPSIGCKVFHIRPCDALPPEIKVSERLLENTLLRLRFDARGRLRSVYDKRHRREVLAPGATGNQFILFEDKMASCGASWDVDIFYNDKPLEFDGKLLSVEVPERGPVRSVLRFRRAIGKSRITQDVILSAESPRIDFQTTVDWGDEHDVMLKAAFPVNIRSENARYETQFGNLERPTHWNLPYDFARFEAPAHKWVDLSEGNYGVALLNDCKYGYDVRDNVMRITLLRAPKDPGKTTDVNRTHTFTYALLPHEGDFTHGVVRAAYELNAPVLARTVKASSGSGAADPSRLSISGANVIVEAVKKAEDDDGIVVRMYEAHGWRTRNVFRTSLPIARAVETDLMENEERELNFRNGALRLDFTPYQIRTVKLMLTS